MSSSTYQCPSCSSGKVRPTRRAGRLERYLAVRNLPVPATLALPECEACGEVFLDAAADKALSDALAEVFSQLVRSRTQRALASLKEQEVRERRVETLLDLSPGYLSRIRAGKETSVALATLLQLFADNTALIDQAEALWQVGATDFPDASRPARKRVRPAPVAAPLRRRLK